MKTCPGRLSRSRIISKLKSQSYKRILTLHRIIIRVSRCSWLIKRNKFRHSKSRLNNISTNWTSCRRISNSSRKRTTSKKKRKAILRPNWQRWRKRTRTCKTSRLSTVRIRWVPSSSWRCWARRKIYRKCRDLLVWSSASTCRCTPRRSWRTWPRVEPLPAACQCKCLRIRWWLDSTINNSVCQWAACQWVCQEAYPQECLECKIKCLQTCKHNLKMQWQWIIRDSSATQQMISEFHRISMPADERNQHTLHL